MDDDQQTHFESRRPVAAVNFDYDAVDPEIASLLAIIADLRAELDAKDNANKLKMLESSYRFAEIVLEESNTPRKAFAFAKMLEYIASRKSMTSQKDLAELLNVSRGYVSRKLKKLTSEHVVLSSLNKSTASLCKKS
jgi:hypothetical protein